MKYIIPENRLKKLSLVSENTFVTPQAALEKDWSKRIEFYLKKMLTENYNYILCDLEVTHPNNRTEFPEGVKSDSYKLTLYLIGGRNSKYWPSTQAVRQKYDDISNDAWNIVHDGMGIALDIFYKFKSEC